MLLQQSVCGSRRVAAPHRKCYISGVEVLPMNITPPKWTKWRPFPDPRKNELLCAPFGPGLYEVRNIRTRELVLVGIGANCSSRMSSLLPSPLGCGRRNNQEKRDYMLNNLEDLEYRCVAYKVRADAADAERRLRWENSYLYNT
jgi:hypothetical protein